MIVVCDTSPISNLFIIGELELLHKIYSEIIVPQAVMNEILELETFGFNIDEIKYSAWIKIAEVRERNELNTLLSQLDLGEAEAIVLAKRLKADWLLVDEAKGRRIAQSAGLKTIGLLGVLLLAKQNGFLSEIKPLLEKLFMKAKFRISQELYYRVLFLANETG